MHDAATTIAIALLTCFAATAAVLATGRFAGAWHAAATEKAQLVLLLAATLGSAAVFAHRCVWVHGGWTPLQAHVDGLLLIAVLLGLMLVFLQIGRRLPGAAAFGGPLLTVILAWAICASAWTYAPFHFAPQNVRRVWEIFHLTGVYSGALLLALAAMAGAMFLIAQRRLRRHAVDIAQPLASLESLERFMIRSVTLGFALLTLGMASGLVIVTSGETSLGPAWWHSPKVLLAFAVWLIYALLMNVRHATAFRGTRAAWLSILGLALLLATFALANAVAKAADLAGRADSQPAGEPLMREPLLGAHVSIAGGLHNALIAARRGRMTCLQVFTKNQRQWRCPPLTREQVKLWQHHRRQTLRAPVVAHAGYLINLAGPPGELRSKSIVLFREELLRCGVLEIPLLVVHPGAHLGSGEQAGLRQVADALDEVHADLPGLTVVTCLEITAGSGTHLGYRFEQLRRIMEMVRQPQRVATCLDTAHLLAAGYDLTSSAAANAVLDEAEQVLGRGTVRAWHLNDSSIPRGARVDRHAHIGHGHIGLEAFALILNLPRYRNVPKVIETPKGQSPGGPSWDSLNLSRLRRLTKGRV